MQEIGVRVYYASACRAYTKNDDEHGRLPSPATLKNYNASESFKGLQSEESVGVKNSPSKRTVIS